MKNFLTAAKDPRRDGFSTDFFFGVTTYGPICYMLGEFKLYTSMLKAFGITLAGCDSWYKHLTLTLGVCRPWGAKNQASVKYSYIFFESARGH